MRRHGLTLLELNITLGVMLLLAIGLSPIFTIKSQEAKRSNCQANLRQISLAIKQYCKDSDDTFPALYGNKYFFGWADPLTPYLRDTQLFQCPSEDTWPARGDGPKARTYTDYFYNANLSRVNEASLQYAAGTVMLGDSVTGDARRNSNGDETKSGSSNLIDLADNPVGAATRHLDGANYAFADGHIKWLKGSNADTCPAIRNPGSLGDSALPTFAIQ